MYAIRSYYDAQEFLAQGGGIVRLAEHEKFHAGRATVLGRVERRAAGETGDDLDVQPVLLQRGRKRGHLGRADGAADERDDVALAFLARGPVGVFLGRDRDAAQGEAEFVRQEEHVLDHRGGLGRLGDAHP